MTLEELFASILELSPAELDDASSPATIDTWDSLTAINLVVGMQETYKVRFTTQEIAAMQCLGDARRVLREKGAAV